ncbi:MAG: endo-1,4-beta-xylanase [Candidatus Brocadiia bacterium]
MHGYLLSGLFLFACFGILAMRAGPPGDLEGAIRRHRMGTLCVQAPPGARVRVDQLEHEFWFGTAISHGLFRDDAEPEDRRRYLEILRENFNSAVHENALKWYQTERRRGEPDFTDAERMVAWCRDNGLRVRGHCIFWCVDRYVQDWLKELDDGELRQAVERRAREVPRRFRGRILEYDVNNEMLHGDFYKDRLGEGIRADMFRWAAEEDPDALLFVNDYNILSGKDAAAYERQIQALLDAGAPVGGIGCQGHFGGDIDMDEVRAALDRLARFDLPIRITEFDINMDDEEKKARLLREFYRTCFAHPAVDGILMWGFWRGRHWRPKAALWEKDFSPTPAAEAYRDLVFDRWWTEWEGEADGEGRCEVPAFYGRHRVTVGGKSTEVNLRKADGTVTLDARDDDTNAW